MDPELDEEAMAEMMGFSSFGGPDRPTKKRRYNPAADAAADSTLQSTGSNSTPLGARKQAEAVNVDEIDLEEGDGDAKEGDMPPKPLLDVPPGSLPRRPAQGAAEATQARQESARDGPWYEGYYDSTSNRNPWEAIEKRMGLQPRDAWPSSPSAGGTAT